MIYRIERYEKTTLWIYFAFMGQVVLRRGIVFAYNFLCLLLKSTLKKPFMIIPFINISIKIKPINFRTMRKLNLMFIVGITCLATACSKSVSEEDAAAKQRATDFQTAVQAHKYKLVAFYSDKAIDYITSDSEVRSETDLWAYVKQHVLDDENYFGANGALTIYQKTDKMPGSTQEEINAQYGITVRGTDVMFKFVDYVYVPTEYKLQEFDNAYFTVYVDGPSGSKLYSKYARIE
jgi:hypothetical protein